MQWRKCLKIYIKFLLFLALSRVVIASDYIQQRSKQLSDDVNRLEVQFRRNQQEYKRLTELFDQLVFYDRQRDSLDMATSYSEVDYRTQVHYDAENRLNYLEQQIFTLKNKQRDLREELWWLRSEVARLQNIYKMKKDG